MLLHLRYCGLKLNPTQLIYRKLATSYTSTINLPKTKFSKFIKKAQRSEHDKNIREKYMKPLYSWQRDHLNGKEFVLHDGPPYANGDVHMGHAVNKILKDIILRQQIVNRNRVHYKPGWDCHGLPIELKAKSIADGMSPIDIRRRARQFAAETLIKQKNEFESWGVTADWDSPNCTYQTFDAKYIKNELELFYKLYEKKLIYRDLKPVYWSPSSKTTLAEAELEYDEKHKSPSLYLRLKLSKAPEILQNYMTSNIYAIIWTTTPWTLPANQAISFSSKLQYALIRLNQFDGYYIIAENLISELKAAMSVENIETILTFNGTELINSLYSHPLGVENDLPFLDGTHVSGDKGTGLVHTAPAHGFDDYLIGIANDIPMKCLVSTQGKYNEDAPDFLKGKEIIDCGDQLVLENIKSDTLHLGTILHKYPIDWRTKKPVIIYPTHQWFINTESIRDDAIAEIQKIKIYPSTASDQKKDNQLIQKVRQRSYWCVSRQRAWGTPIPVFYRKDTDEVIITKKIIEHLCSLLESDGNIDYWWEKDVKDLIPLEALQEINLQSDDVVKGNDILDIWFDSGISWSYALDPPQVADLYLEGCDQFTGWFQSSLMTSVAARGISPFRSIYVHGFTVDEKGSKMSKSIGNVTHPKDIINDNNVDVIRWWIASHVDQTSIPVKAHLIAQSSECVNKLRGILKFLLGYAERTPMRTSAAQSPYTFDYEQLSVLDKYALNLLAEFEEKTQQYAKNYQFCNYINSVTYFTELLSASYMHPIKDKLYCGSSNDFDNMIKVLLAQFYVINKILWPIVPFLVEECWSYYSKGEPFYKTTVNIPNLWRNDQYDNCIEYAEQIKIANFSHISWRWNVIINGNTNQIENLQKLHPSDGKSHNDSILCEILQVQSVQLKQIDANELIIEKIEINGELCQRCRRFAVPIAGAICPRCERVLNEQKQQ